MSRPVRATLLVVLALSSPVLAATITGSATTLLPGYDLAWTIDTSAAELTVTITAATTGWVGFGLASSGGMHGADMMMAFVDDVSGVGTIGDYHSFSSGTPIADEQQDWTLVSSSQTGGSTTIVAKRALETADQQDWPISASSPAGQQVIAAFGPSDTLSAYHTAAGRKATQLDLFRPQDGTLNSMASVHAIPGVGYWNLTAQGYISRNPCTGPTLYPGTAYANGVTHVKSECIDAVTDYTDFCLDLTSPSLLGSNGEAHLVALEYVIEQINSDVLHHYVVYGHTSTDCSDNGDIRAGEHVGGWAPGVNSFILPADVGIRVGGGGGAGSGGGYRSIGLNVHYDNPTMRALIDFSGVRLWYTPTLRPYDMGVMQLGDPRVQLASQGGLGSIPAGVSKYAWRCGSFSTMQWSNSGSGGSSGGGGGSALNVLYTQLHMHQSGIAMELKLEDQSGAFKRGLKTDYYDFKFQGTLPETEYNHVDGAPSMIIQPGDRLTTTCWFNNDGRAGPIASHRFGLASNDEMCIAFVAYYPKLDGGHTTCKLGIQGETFLGVTAMSSTTTEDVFTNRSFGRAASLVAAEGVYAGGVPGGGGGDGDDGSGSGGGDPTAKGERMLLPAVIGGALAVSVLAVSIGVWLKLRAKAPSTKKGGGGVEAVAKVTPASLPVACDVTSCSSASSSSSSSSASSSSSVEAETALTPTQKLAQFCSACGAPFAADTNKFCVKCGAKRAGAFAV